MTFLEFAPLLSGKKFISSCFIRNGKPAEEPAVWGMTVRSAGSMRFRWNEENPAREKLLSEIAGPCSVVPVQLDHTKIVYLIEEKCDTFQKIGDGLITRNRNLMPVVTVADCMPLYFSDNETGFFGIVHSGWKGTGIAAEAVSLAVEKYGARRENISVAIGAHIRSCCYIVNKERADYFSRNFTEDCVSLLRDGEIPCEGLPVSWNNGSGPFFRLSLEKANLAVLAKAGIRDENIVVSKDCTCHNPEFGSNRRETASGTEFTVQAAFVKREDSAGVMGGV